MDFSDKKLTSLLNQLANDNNVSIDSIRKEIENSISEAYKTNNSIMRSIAKDGNKPSIEEFISFMLARIKKGH